MPSLYVHLTTTSAFCRIHHLSPSIAATPRWCQVSSIHFDNLGTTTYGGPLTTSGTSTSPFHSHSLPAHCAMPTPDRRWDHFLLHLLWALHGNIVIECTDSSIPGKVVVKIFFFIVFHGNPLFSVLRPTNILLHETICEKGLLRFYPRFQPQLRFCPDFFLLCIFTPTVQIQGRRLPLFVTPLHASGLKNFGK